MRLGALTALVVVLLPTVGVGCAATSDAPDDADQTSDALLDHQSDIGSVDWLVRTRGHLGIVDTSLLTLQGVRTFGDGFVRRVEVDYGIDGATTVDFDRFGPPDTAMVRAARSYLAAHAVTDMINHCHRTAYWTVMMVDRVHPVTANEIEVAWVAALLHDIGLEERSTDGSDFSLVGIDVVKTLAAQSGWRDDQVALASEAIAQNTNTWVNRKRYGLVPWAMQVGGSAEVAYSPYRALMARASIERLESAALYPRGAMGKTGAELINREADTVRDGRFALLRRLGFLQFARP